MLLLVCFIADFDHAYPHKIVAGVIFLVIFLFLTLNTQKNVLGDFFRFFDDCTYVLFL